MAQKELTIKINVKGQELTLTGKQIDLFKKSIVDLKQQLADLGERTEQNSEIFDKLKGDIEALDKAFSETKTEVTETGDAIEETGNKTKDADGKVKSYAAQIRILRNDLAALGERTVENAVEYDDLTSRIVDLSEKQEDLQFTTKKLDDAVSQLPGVVGKAGQVFKTFDDGLKNAKTAMNGLTKQFPILKNAIAATGIGALVIILGLVVAAVVKAAKSFKPLEDAFSKLGVLMDLVMETLKPFTDFILNVVVGAIELYAKGIALLTGNLDEYNKKAADKVATEEFAKNVEKQGKFIDASIDKYDEFTQRKIKANQTYKENVIKTNADEALSEKEKQALLKLYREQADREIGKADADRQKKTDDNNKAITDKNQATADKNRQIEEDYQKRLNTVQSENALLRLTDEKAKGELKLKQDYDNQIKEIDGLKVNDTKKKKLREETLENYKLKLKEFNDAIAKEVKAANDDLEKQNRDLNTSMIKDDKLRMEQEAKDRRDDAIKAIDETKASEEAKAKAKLIINQKYANDVSKIDEEIAKKNKENLYKQIEFERESRRLGLDNKLRDIDLSTKSEVEKIKARSLVFQEQALIDQTAETDNLNKQLAAQEISETEHKNRLKIVDDAYNLAIRENTVKTEKEILEQRQANRDAVNMLGASIGNLAQAMGEETVAGKALIKVQQGLALATTMSAIADQLKGLGQAAKLPFPANIIAIATFIGTIGTAIGQFKSLFGVSPKDLTKGDAGGASAPAGNSAASMGKNYGDGGMINGPRHAQGGTLINAEGGEAVMTRGAVTLFKPMLSMMNQMGGGTSFNPTSFSGYDNPKISVPSQEQSPMIMKTYVVSSEMTSDQERQARLKDLSTL